MSWIFIYLFSKLNGFFNNGSMLLKLGVTNQPKLNIYYTYPNNIYLL